MKNILISTSLLILIAGNFCLGQDTLRLRPYFKELRVTDVTINGTAYTFLFDTGGGETFLSKNIADSLQKDVYGKVTGIRMNGEQLFYQKADSIVLQVGKTTLLHPTIGVWNVMEVLPKELPVVDGILSLKSFQNQILTIDLHSNLLIIETEASFQLKKLKMRELPVRFVNGLNGIEKNILVCIQGRQHRYWFLFDTGNIGPAILNKEIAACTDLVNSTSGSSLNEFPTIFQSGSFKFAATTTLDTILYDGALNYQSLEQYIFTIDFKTERMWGKEIK